MFEPGFDQAAGLRGNGPGQGAVLIPVASPASPALAYELVCALATHLNGMGQAVVVVDGNATEPGRRTGTEPGLLQALQDPSVSGLARAADGSDWLVMPAAQGLQALLHTARAGGAQTALSRLLSPFACDAVLLLLAPAPVLAALFEGFAAHPLVPVLNQPQATLGVYGAVKQLFAAGHSPVLVHQAMDDAVAAASLQKTVSTVRDCAQRHLGLDVEVWPCGRWDARLLEIALQRQPVRERRETQGGAAFARQATEDHLQWS